MKKKKIDNSLSLSQNLSALLHDTIKGGAMPLYEGLRRASRKY